jgi:hypothetical protein
MHHLVPEVRQPAKPVVQYSGAARLNEGNTLLQYSAPGDQQFGFAAAVMTSRILFIQRDNKDSAMTPHTVEYPYIKFNGNSGYSRHGDSVSLFADRIDNLNNADITSGNLALQLWACQTPYTGGDLTGWKLAEFPLGILQANYFLGPVRSEVPANLPESGEYAIVLVISEWDGTGFNLIHDFHNYPCRDLFLHPHFDGLVRYRCVDESRIVVDVEHIHNARAPNNMSGTLSLELWALPEPYVRGDFAGHALAAVTLGSLSGGASWRDCSYDLDIIPPPAGSYTLVLMLREWVGKGYVTRDHSSFSNRVTFPIVISAPRDHATAIADEIPGRTIHTVQPTEQATSATVTEPVGDAGCEAGAIPSIDKEQAHSTRERETVSIQPMLDKLKSSTQRLLHRLKQQLSL